MAYGKINNIDKLFIKRRFNRNVMGTLVPGNYWTAKLSNMPIEIPSGYIPVGLCKVNSGSNSLAVGGFLPISIYKNPSTTGNIMFGRNESSGDVSSVQPTVTILFVKEEYATLDET